MIPGWKDELQQDYLDFLRTHRTASPAEVAAHLNISESSAVFWLTDLAREGKVRLRAVELVEEAGLAGKSQTALARRRKDHQTPAQLAA